MFYLEHHKWNTCYTPIWIKISLMLPGSKYSSRLHSWNIIICRKNHMDNLLPSDSTSMWILYFHFTGEYLMLLGQDHATEAECGEVRIQLAAVWPGGLGPNHHLKIWPVSAGETVSFIVHASRFDNMREFLSFYFYWFVY